MSEIRGNYGGHLMDVECLSQLWDEKNKEEKGRNGADSWDRRAEDFNVLDSDERVGKITSLLLDKKMLREDSTVLDIGCGTGKFVVEFARWSKKVVGLDFSTKMLQYAKENVAAQQLHNAAFVEMDWSEVDIGALRWKKKFSLVTAIMSPAFDSRKSLDKIIAASSEYCFFCHFVEKHEPIYDRLKSIIGRKTAKDFGSQAIYFGFNILWQYELFPEICYFRTERESTRPVEEANRSYLARLEAKGPLSSAQKIEVTKCLNKMAVNGQIKEKITGKVGCLYWKNGRA
jgi:SAM-dependent methyltransferase